MTYPTELKMLLEDEQSLIDEIKEAKENIVRLKNFLFEIREKLKLFSN
jgi:hypothetical protein